MKNLASSSIFHHFLKKDLKFSSWVKLVAFVFKESFRERGKKEERTGYLLDWFFFFESSLKPPVVDPFMLH